MKKIEIEKRRRKFGYSQEYLAKQIGVSRPTYIQIEKGQRELSVSEAQKLASLFNMGLAAFLEGESPSEPKVILEKQKHPSASGLKVIVPSDKVRKFKEILLYVLSKIGAQPNVGQTALYKLLYFMDFDYYEQYGQKLIGATYIKNHYGPTPVEFGEIIAEMEKEKLVEPVKSSYFQYRQKKYLPLRIADLSVLTGQEKALIDKTLDRLADKNARQLSDYSHGDAPWQMGEMGRKIDYEWVFERTEPYACRNYLAIAGDMARMDAEKHLEPLSQEEIDYYENLIKENEKKGNQMR